MPRPANKPWRCSACLGSGHNARTCAVRLPEGQRRCACGGVYTVTTTKQTRCPPCHRANMKMRAIQRDEMKESA